MASPAPPTNVTATVDSNDQITVSWDHDPTWFAFDGNDSSLGGFDEGRWYSSDSVDHFEIEITRDGIGYKNPSGGPTTVNGDDSASYSATYGPNSDYGYGTQVGIDSSFKFRVRAVNADGSSTWDHTSVVYTDPIPPHNPSVSRPSSSKFTISYTVQTDIPDLVIVEAREDTGSGYSSWFNLDNISDPSKGNSVSKTYETGVSYAYDSLTSGDSRVQFRLRSYNNNGPNIRRSNYVYTDYGNSGNVFFTDDFESNDLSKWRNTPGAYTSSGSGMDSGFSGADQGTYYAILDGDSKIDVGVGDLSNESDVIVKAAVAVGSADSSGEEMAVDFWDGSNWQQLTDFHWEYNKQGWVEMTALVPNSYLNSDCYIRFESESGGGGDHYYIDRVVVSDILHEYTRPATPTNLSADNSVEDEISVSWTDNAAFEENNRVDYKATSDSSWNNNYVGADTTSETITSLADGEKYDIRVLAYKYQDRHGNSQDWYGNYSSIINSTTILPSPSSPSSSGASDTSLDVSWTDASDNEDGFRVYYKKSSASTWTQFSDLSAGTTSETITGLTQNTTYDVHVEGYTEHVSSDSTTTTTTTYLNESRSTASHSALKSSSVISTIDLNAPVSSHSTAMQAGSTGVIDLLEGASSYANSISGGAGILLDLDANPSSHLAASGSSTTTLIELDVGVNSHSTAIASSADGVISLLVGSASHANTMASASQRSGITFGNRSPSSFSGSSESSSLTVIDLLESTSSEAHLSASDSTRSAISFERREGASWVPSVDSSSIGVIDVAYGVGSHSDDIRVFSITDRVSLELIDHEIHWNDAEAFWYTNWFPETKILGSEDTLAVRSLVVDGAKEPAAIVALQYDADGNGKVDAESDPVELGRDQQVYEITGVPIDEDGRYRLKIMEYSGYNSLYALDTAITH